MIGKSSGRWGLSGFIVAAALAGFGSTAQAQWSTSFTDMGVVYRLTDLTVGSSATHMYLLGLNTTGYNHHAPPAYLDSVDIKAWSGGSESMSFSLLSAPNGAGAWRGTEGPISSGPVSNTGCGGSGAGFACVEALDKGFYSVAAGNPYSFLFSVTASNAALFLTSAVGAHIGAGYADAAGRGAGYGITSVTVPIPEPETYAMLLAGLGLMAFVARRRRRAH